MLASPHLPNRLLGENTAPPNVDGTTGKAPAVAVARPPVPSITADSTTQERNRPNEQFLRDRLAESRAGEGKALRRLR